MVLILLALSFPFVGAFVMFAFANFSHRIRGFTASLIAFSSFLFVLVGSYPVFQGDTIQLEIPWFTELGISLSFYVDGLSLMFLLLISGIGTLVCLYAIGYLHNDRIDVLFWFSLLIFMGSMLGIVISGDLIVLLIFWELTSISSFLLIGIEYWKDKARRGALNALFVTAAGGLCLLAGLLMIASVADTFSLIHLLESGSIRTSPFVTTAMVLLLLGAFTKSAHFPFHFWLPQAMAAPTPVSAYLHSATMVKAGIYLILRFNPIFESHPYWSPLIMVMGLLTFTVGGIMAVSQEDSKALLAYSTISQLGMITFMIGIGTSAALLGAVFHILAHATFKGALFMGAGAIDHTLGTRRLDLIGPMRKSMPVISWIMALSALSMAGIIPFSGFVSKEAMFKGIIKLKYISSNWILAGAVVASIFTFLYSMRFVIELPFYKKRRDFSGGPEHSPIGLDRWLLRIPPAILCISTILLGIGLFEYFGTTAKTINDAIHSIGSSLGHHLHFHFALWHGFNPPLILTGIVVFTGLALYLLLPMMRGFWSELAKLAGPEDINRVFQDNVVDVTHDVLDVIIQGPLNKYLRIMISFVLFLGISAWFITVENLASPLWFPSSAVSYAWLPFLLVIVGGIAILSFEDPVPAVIALGSIGFLISLVFLVYRAPDLILTQISVETVSIVIFLWVLKDIDFSGDRTRNFRSFDFLISLASAFGVSYFLMHTLSAKEGLSIPAEYYINFSLPKAWGHNMVNVILVDFRALDTLGEISVLGIATVGILALLQVVLNSANGRNEVKE